SRSRSRKAAWWRWSGSDPSPHRRRSRVMIVERVTREDIDGPIPSQSPGPAKGNFFNENQIDGAGSNLPDPPPASGFHDAADDFPLTGGRSHPHSTRRTGGKPPRV